MRIYIVRQFPEVVGGEPVTDKFIVATSMHEGVLAASLSVKRFYMLVQASIFQGGMSEPILELEDQASVPETLHLLGADKTVLFTHDACLEWQEKYRDASFLDLKIVPTH